MSHRRNKLIVVVVSLLCVLSVSVIASAAYLNTNRDTRKAPAAARSDLTVSSGYQLLYETGKFQYYFRDDRDIIAIRNKDTGYLWKTGIDMPFEKQVENAKDAVLSGDAAELERTAKRYDMTVDQIKELAKEPVEDSMNTTYVAMANSLITVECYDGTGDQMTTKKYSSASDDEDDGTSAIQMIGGDASTGQSDKWVLKVTFKGIDLAMNVYITFSDDGSVSYDIPYKEIEGKGMDILSTVSITPFLGASGGREAYYNAADGKWSEIKNKYAPPGYVMVPDGSGSLIRFANNTSKFSDYEGDVYGTDPSAELLYYSSLTDMVPLQNPVMPVFGISQGDGTQSAFVAYADDGEEYMQIIATPQSTAKNQIRYTFAYAKFDYNIEYFQVTTESGATYRKTREKPNEFDIHLTYSFLYGDGSDGEPRADYTGMAMKYREHLIEQGTLKTLEADGGSDGSIPIRLDFLMSDAKKGVISSKQVTMTNTENVDAILSDVEKNGIKNINSGLIGWQKMGETLSKPGKAKYSGDIGGKGDFSDLIGKYAKKGIDISLSRDFVTINKSMMGYYNNAAKHNNTQYVTVNKSTVLPENCPVTSFSYALPTRTAQWIGDLYDAVGDYSNSLTVTGMSNVLVSSHNSDGSETSRSEAIDLYRKAVKKIKDDGAKINMENPNQYLWEYTDRYLQSPVGTTQYVYETDTVPFLQMVLHGTMEMYAPYSNFSFYSQPDILRMIDYNISPSFILTEEPSYLLASTPSSNYYSTEYDQYESLIQSIYTTVNDALSQVAGYEWTGRDVLEDGVIANTYTNGSDTRTIIINYTDDAFTSGGATVGAQSAEVIEGGLNG